MPTNPLLLALTPNAERISCPAAESIRPYGSDLNGDEASFVHDVREENILRRASGYLTDTLQTIENGMSADFIVIDLRSVWETLGEITGETAGEGIIDAIFSKFCLGK